MKDPSSAARFLKARYDHLSLMENTKYLVSTRIYGERMVKLYDKREISELLRIGKQYNQQFTLLDAYSVNVNSEGEIMKRKIEPSMLEWMVSASKHSPAVVQVQAPLRECNSVCAKVSRGSPLKARQAL